MSRAGPPVPQGIEEVHVDDGPMGNLDDPRDPGDMAAQARFALETLAELDGGNGVSLPRLAKRTGLRVSVLLRLYTLMSDARVGDDAGPGSVRLHVDEDGRWIAKITPAGRGDGEGQE